jgi:hypothetical protein
MSDEFIEAVERQLAAARAKGAPTELRGAVLRGVHLELAATRWDRLLARAAAVLLAVGVGLNAAAGMQSLGSGGAKPSRVAQLESRESLLETAVVVAEATNAATGSLYARQLAAMSGQELTADEAAAIDAAAERAAIRDETNGNKG